MSGRLIIIINSGLGRSKPYIKSFLELLSVAITVLSNELQDRNKEISDGMYGCNFCFSVHIFLIPLKMALSLSWDAMKLILLFSHFYSESRQIWDPSAAKGLAGPPEGEENPYQSNKGP